jgi:D-arabinose 1-dehydrogenase-like Zn-dependent alcohol dehydrogenase
MDWTQYQNQIYCVQVGKNVTDIKVGDKVGVGCISDSCMACIECQQVKNYK